MGLSITILGHLPFCITERTFIYILHTLIWNSVKELMLYIARWYINDTLLFDYVLTLTIFLVSNLVINFTEFGSLHIWGFFITILQIIPHLLLLAYSLLNMEYIWNWFSFTHLEISDKAFAPHRFFFLCTHIWVILIFGCRWWCHPTLNCNPSILFYSFCERSHLHL